MPQTSVQIAPAAAVIAGLIADIQPRTIRSLLSEESTSIAYGLFVKKGTADNQFKLPTAAADKIIGVLAHTHSINTLGLGAADEPIALKDVVNVLTRGAVYVYVEEAVTPADPVYVRIADGVADAERTQKGAVRKSSDTNTAVLVRGARFLSSAAADELALVEFDAAAESAVKGIDTAIAKIGLTPGAEAAVAANAIEVAGQLQDADGNPVAAAKQVRIRTIAVTDDKGDIAAAGTPVGTLKKAINPATGANEAWMTTTAAGAFSFRVTDDQAEDVLVEVATEDGITALKKLTFA
jgi:hypothetical protein